MFTYNLDDAYHLTRPQPEGEGLQRAIIEALRLGKVRPSEIDMINAHAASTIAGDEAEIKALQTVFSNPKLDHSLNSEDVWSDEQVQNVIDKERLKEVFITSNKGHIGHTLGAAGGIESVLSILSIRDGIIPPIANLENPIQTEMNLVKEKPIKKQITTVLKESIAFGGTNACIIYKKL